MTKAHLGRIVQRLRREWELLALIAALLVLGVLAAVFWQFNLVD